jgi:hypothetical protein
MLRRAWTTVGILSALLLAGCGVGGADDLLQPDGTAPPAESPVGDPVGDPVEPGSPETLEASLTALGVDTSSQETPRLDGDGLPYPDTFAPFGHRFTMTEMPDGSMLLGQPSALLCLGFRLRGRTDHWTLLNPLGFGAAPTAGDVNAAVVREDDPAWAEDVTGKDVLTGTSRSAAACDVDGDGQDELVFVHVDSGVVTLEVVHPETDGAEDIEQELSVPFDATDVTDVRLAGGDLDQDGRAELALVLSRASLGVTTLLVLGDAESGFAQEYSRTFTAVLTGSALLPVVKLGNIDYDGAQELVVVVNEREGGSPPRSVWSRYHVFDDANAGYAQLATGQIRTFYEGEEIVAGVLDVSIGNLDDDRAGELVFAGLDKIVRTCGPDSGVGEAGTQRKMLVVLDDALREFAPLAESTDLVAYANCPAYDAWLTAFLPVNTVDLDGDDDREIQVGDVIFDRVPEPGVSWDGVPPREVAEAQALEKGIPLPNFAYRPWGTYVFPKADESATAGWIFDRGRGTAIVADVDADGRQDLVTYRQGAANGTAYAVIEAWSTDEDAALVRLFRVEVEDDEQGEKATHPLLLPVANPLRTDDGESLPVHTFEFTREHTVGFTEPSVIAVLAAPPSVAGIDQNYDGCATTWGLSKSTGIEAERQIRFSTGIGIGFKFTIPWVQIESEGQVVLQGALARNRTDAYEITKSVSFTAGPLEDAVVFSSIPVDNYVYQVVASPNVGRIGSQVVMSLPRNAVVRIAERKYYNLHVNREAMQIDATIFEHKIGELDTYPTTADKERILDERRSQLEDSRLEYNLRQEHRALFDPIEALRGLSTETVGVGEGGGETEVALEITESSGEGRALALGFEAEFEQTVLGLKTVFQIGFEAEWATQITFATGTNFVGTVGSIGPDDFADNQYNFGLFTYLQADPTTNREFHVVNYWVAR